MPMTDHLGRDDKDFAIEFGEYLATSAEHFMAQHNQFMKALSLEQEPDRDALSDVWSGLANAIYEFRKRATRAGHKPSAEKFNR
jgi:hypothetical protein